MGDLVQAVRSLLRSPAFTIVAILTLALGIAANTAVFSFSDAMLNRPFPFPELGRVIQLWTVRPASSYVGNHVSTTGSLDIFTAAEYLALKRESSDLATVTPLYLVEHAVQGLKDGPEWEQGVQTTPDYFESIGMMPALGRGFTEEEMLPGKNKVAVVSQLFRKLRMNDDPNPVGKTITMDYGNVYTVVGVMPARYENTYPQGGVRVITPLHLTEAQATDREKRNLHLFGRLKEGGSVAVLKSQLASIAGQWGQQFPESNAGWKLDAVPIKDTQRVYFAPFAGLFRFSAVFVLLIGCANLASLLLARAIERQRKVAVQAAIGASKWQIARQILAESFIVSLVGGLLALGLAYRGVEMIRTGIPDNMAWFINGWGEIRMDGSAFAFGLIVALAATLIFGLIPAIQASRTDLTQALKDAGTTASGGVFRRRMRYGLVIAQVTMAFILMVGSALMFRGISNMADFYRGHEVNRVLTTRISLPEDTYPDRRSMAQFLERLQERLNSGAIGDIKSSSLSTNLFGTLRGLTAGNIKFEGRTGTTGDFPAANLITVSGNYFETVKVPLVKGRTFGSEDGTDAPQVAVISETMAKRLFPEGDAVGKRFQVVGGTAYAVRDESGQLPMITVVGIVGDVKQYWVDKEPRNTMYFPHTQVPRRQISLMIRTGGDPYAISKDLRALVLSVDPDRPLYGTRSLELAQNQNLATLKVFASIMGVFGAVALLLAAIGIYGVIAYQVSQRAREVAIRLSVGAEPAQMVRMVLGETSKLLGVGLAVGLVGAMGLTRLATNRLFGITGFPLTSLLLMALGVAVIGLMAGFLPARRTAALDPATALRHD